MCPMQIIHPDKTIKCTFPTLHSSPVLNQTSGFYLSSSDPLSHTRHFLQIMGPPWFFCHSETDRLSVWILCPVYQDEAMSKTLVKLSLSPPDLLLSYQLAMALAGLVMSLLRDLNRIILDIHKHLLLVMCPCFQEFQSKMKAKHLQKLQANLVIKIAFAVHNFVWKYHCEQGMYCKIAVQTDMVAVFFSLDRIEIGQKCAFLSVHVTWCRPDLSQRIDFFEHYIAGLWSTKEAPNFWRDPRWLALFLHLLACQNCYMHQGTTWHFSFITNFALFASHWKPERQHSWCTWPYQLLQLSVGEESLAGKLAELRKRTKKELVIFKNFPRWG